MQTVSIVIRRNPLFLLISRYLRSVFVLGGLTVLHGGKESHDLILVHDHCTDSVHDLKVFQLRLLVIQLFKLLLKVLNLLFSLCDVRTDLLILGIPRKISFRLIVGSSKGIEMRLPIRRVDGCVLDGIAAVQHDSITHINADMRNARCVIGSLKEDEITRLHIRL